MSEKQRASLARDRENRARLAFSLHTITVRGSGALEIRKRIPFDVSFATRPNFAPGAIMDMEDLALMFGRNDADTPPLPQVTVVVTEYDQNEFDFYVGAWVAVVISYEELPVGEVTYEFDIDLTFLGIGIKDVDPEVLN